MRILLIRIFWFQFVITAKNVCQMLRKAGYWADFINPFSGRPYFSNGSRDLYKTSEKFRCLDFEIYEIQNCIVISNDEPESKRSFVGSLFTNAPSQKKSLADIFTKWEDELFLCVVHIRQLCSNVVWINFILKKQLKLCIFSTGFNPEKVRPLLLNWMLILLMIPICNKLFVNKMRNFP